MCEGGNRKVEWCSFSFFFQSYISTYKEEMEAYTAKRRAYMDSLTTEQKEARKFQRQEKKAKRSKRQKRKVMYNPDPTLPPSLPSPGTIIQMMNP